MKIYKFAITPEIYNAIPLEERVLFLAVGHFTNEIHALRKLILIGSNTEENHAISRHGVATQNVMLIKILITKAHEAYRFLKKESEKAYFKKLESNIHIDSCIRNLHGYFQNNHSNLSWVRDKLGAHYDTGLIKRAAKNSISDTHYIYLSEQQGNSLYFLSEEILFTAISKDQSPQTAFPQLVDDVNKIAGWITDCAQNIMLHIDEHYIEPKRQIQSDKNSEIIDAKDFTELSIPFFIDFSNANFGN